MKIIYLYFNDLTAKTGDVPQTFNMLHAFANLTETTFISSWTTKKHIQHKLTTFHLSKNFKHIRLPIKLITSNMYLEMSTRFLYCLAVILYTRFSKEAIIYTRDFSFVYFLSMMPAFLRPKNQIFYEPHKIYHAVSHKVSFEQEKKALEIPDLFFPISKGIQTDLIAFFGIKKYRIKVVPDGVNLAGFQAQANQLSNLSEKNCPKTEGKKVIIYTGSFLEWKGVDVLVKAVKFMQQKDFCVLLIGGNPQSVKEIKKLCEKEKVADLVSVMGFIEQDQLVPLLKSASIAVAPNTKAVISKRYTSPLKIFEYLGASLPIVASNLESLREILMEGENCLFFEAENAVQLAQKLDYLLSEKALMQKMSKNNLLVAQEYDWQKRAERILQFSRRFSKKQV